MWAFVRSSIHTAWLWPSWLLCGCHGSRVGATCHSSSSSFKMVAGDVEAGHALPLCVYMLVLCVIVCVRDARSLINENMFIYCSLQRSHYSALWLDTLAITSDSAHTIWSLCLSACVSANGHTRGEPLYIWFNSIESDHKMATSWTRTPVTLWWLFSENCRKACSGLQRGWWRRFNILVNVCNKIWDFWLLWEQ